MTLASGFAPHTPDPAMAGVIKLAVMAVGGQGGGVLTGWIETLARANGYDCQATSVAGVAQRTGATIYYVEMAPRSTQPPVFALLPAAGDVDILIAAEMMEAGRAILRGFVTPDRTVLIASTHRALAVSEKTVPGDGIADAAEVRAAAAVAARAMVMFDMEALAQAHGSVISASLFGALAGAGVLPFPQAAFEQAIRSGGKGVDRSLAAFAAASEIARSVPEPAPEKATTTRREPGMPKSRPYLISGWQALTDHIATWPPNVSEIAGPGLRKVVDFQDLAYGAEYLDRVGAVLMRDDAARGFELSREAAKHVANAMAYDDPIRVADLKTRAERLDRIRTEMGAEPGTVLQVTEYLHPRAEEIVGLLPARFGARMAANPVWMRRIDRWFGRGRHLRSDGLLPFAALYLVGGLRGWRRKCLRHAQEKAHLDRWLADALGYLPGNYPLACEVLRCRRLIKGYSDTQSRGLSKFDRVIGGIALVSGRSDAADWARRLREAALKDEEGRALDGALQTIRSFS